VLSRSIFENLGPLASLLIITLASSLRCFFLGSCDTASLTFVRFHSPALWRASFESLTFDLLPSQLVPSRALPLSSPFRFWLDVFQKVRGSECFPVMPLEIAVIFSLPAGLKLDWLVFPLPPLPRRRFFPKIMFLYSDAPLAKARNHISFKPVLGTILYDPASDFGIRVFYPNKLKNYGFLGLSLEYLAKCPFQDCVTCRARSFVSMP